MPDASQRTGPVVAPSRGETLVGVWPGRELPVRVEPGQPGKTPATGGNDQVAYVVVCSARILQQIGQAQVRRTQSPLHHQPQPFR